MQQEEKWDLVVKPQSSLFDINFKEVWRYRDLLVLFVKRDIVAVYKQTILGPIWFVLQPLVQTIVFNFAFSSSFSKEISGCPYFLFTFCGLTCWNYFAECLNNTSNTFINNASIFGKVYFPRLITPLSIVTSSVIKFLIQFVFFLALLVYFVASGRSGFEMSWYVLLVPFLIILMAFLGLSIGIIISSMTTKYRDLRFLIAFGVQLLMFLSPVLMRVSENPRIHFLQMLNPMSSILETFKFVFLGSGAGTISWMGLLYSTVFTIVSFFVAVVIFNKVEKSFMDTV
ncbi:MAG: transporter [Bacteroidetes bacterium]|nr:transporter [Bacteroidota bacterium]